MSHREDVLAALIRAKPATVSGQSLADDLGISRVAVGKHIAVLRDAGYRIEAEAGTGYRLEGRPDIALPSEVAPLLDTSLWTDLSWLAETDSTNDDLKRAAREGAPEGSVVIAGRQRAGRGRLGRVWASPEGGVYVSMLLRPGMPLAETGPVPLVVGIGVARGMETLGVREVGLKWPNDVWVEGRKLAGVLVESSAESDRVEWLVVGVGLNVRRAAGTPDDTSFLGDALDVRIPEAAAALLDGVAGAWERFRVAGFGDLRAEYEERSVLTRRDVTVSDAKGNERVRGRFAGVDGDGRMLIEGPDGTAAVAAGDVTLSRERT